MFFTSYKNNFSTDFINQDISLRSGIPKDYYHLKDHVFQDWEIPPWELFIYKDKILGKGSFSTNPSGISTPQSILFPALYSLAECPDK